MFGSTNECEAYKFFDFMASEFEMSLVRELKYFHGIQIKQSGTEIFLSQTKFVKEIVKNSVWTLVRQ